MLAQRARERRQTAGRDRLLLVIARLAVTSGSDTRLWNVTTRRPPGATIKTGGNPWLLSPSGTALAVADANVAVDLWDTSSGRALSTELVDDDETFDTAFRADGSVLATASFNGLQFWDVAAGQRIGSPLPDDNDPTAIAFDPAGTELAAAGSNDNIGPHLLNENAAQLWDVDPLTPVGAAPYLCAETGAPLSPAQWARYALGTPTRTCARRLD